MSGIRMEHDLWMELAGTDDKIDRNDEEGPPFRFYVKDQGYYGEEFDVQMYFQDCSRVAGVNPPPLTFP